MSSKFKILSDQSLHFVTFATVQWIDVLTRPEYKDIVIESMEYCQNNKGLIVYAYVIMSNHIHLIISAKEGYKLSDILRDLKKYTSKKIINEIENNDRESRKKWILWLFFSSGKRNSNNERYQVWQQDNRPIELSDNNMIDQRLDYVHNNPVRAGIVFESYAYKYSSAIDYCGDKGIMKIKFIE